MDAPIYLGGDLHAIHPRSPDCRSGAGRDPSLDGASITLAEHGRGAVEVTADQGIWCLAVPEDLCDFSPFVLRDSLGRLRTWLLLPLPRLMIGIGHLWLRSVPAPPGPVDAR